MTKHMNLSSVLVSTLGALVLFVLTAMFVTPAKASSVEGYTASTKAPIVLAYYYGPRYNGPAYHRGPNWVGPRCVNNCFRNRWGNMQCVRHCN